VSSDAVGTWGGVIGIVGAGAALAIGFGLIPSAADLKRVEAKADRVEVAEREIAVQGQQIKEIRSTVERIETRQTQQFDRIMRALREREAHHGSD
tara:strand:+ start:931 stop:1215 length:285 start_codon:yes stop_codon:yes gene_type:complete